MSKIRVLSDHLANQIAAGEVVERPSSVAKELVENSIDAGARRIEMEVEGGGRRLLRVVDDGEGMTRDDAVLAFERHATSKIFKVEDLSAIQTLGFRGEALASVASVARVELVTKTESEAEATRVTIEGGRMRDVSPAPHPRGTTITARDLFFNVPARRKFLRSEATESFHLTNLVTHYALAHPEISFVLTNNGREILRAAQATDLRERAYQIFGAEFIGNLLEVGGGDPRLARVSGFVSAPRERRTSRDAQYLFVNGRFVRDRLVSRALMEGYRAVLPNGVYPAALLFLEVPFEEVDVNVHPAKTEVRFRRAAAITDAVREAVRASLARGGYVTIFESEVREDVDESVAAHEAAMQSSPPPQASETTTRDGAPSANTEAVPANPQAATARTLEQSRIAFNAIVDDEIWRVPDASTIDADTAPDDTQNALARSVFAERERYASSAQSRDSIANQGDPDSFDAAPFLPTTFENLSSPDAPSATRAASLPPNSAANTNANQAASFTSNSNANQAASPTSNPNATLPPFDSALPLVREVELEKLTTDIRPLGQLGESFIIATDEEGLLLIDQHVAHERILFDKFRRMEAARQAESQQLLIPETFDLTPAQAVAFDSIAEQLEAYGFGLMRLSGRTIAVRSVPADLPAGEARNLLTEVLDTIEPERRGSARADIRDRLAASLACRAAIKINTPLAIEKMQWLIDRVLTTVSPTTCPHGRPVILRLRTRDILKGFHRT